MLEPDEIIGKFYLRIKDKYPDLSLEDITQICQAPFLFLREKMAMISLPMIRFKYWGVFKVKEGRLKAIPAILADAKTKYTSPATIERMEKIVELKSDK